MPDQVKPSAARESARSTAGQRARRGIVRLARGTGTRLWSTRRRRLVTVGTSGGLLASVLVGGLYLWFQDPGAQPGGKGARKLVIAYIDALADGDMDEACHLMHPRVTASMDRADGGCPGAMRAQVGDRLSGKERGRVRAIDVGPAQVEGRTARVEVRSGADGTKKSTVVVERVNDHWRVLED
ncbi:hypothetical protein [Streptomyces sp. NPDC051162]|uniref:hypothetical protein n=1 Tax=unclassified Streptomyces TaxID=2593676 RepID=UPI00342F6B51